MKKIISFNKFISVLILGLTPVFSYAANTSMNYSVDLSKTKSTCSDKIIELETKISVLKERIDFLEKNTSRSSNADTWICIYSGFSITEDGYTATGPTRAIAALRARQQCKTQDKVNNGLFCKEKECYQ